MDSAKTETEKNGKETEGGKEESELDSKIIRQIEYYFGDINLVKDKFLQEQVKLDDGWIPLETMLKFNRLANLSKDKQVILDALKKSTSGLMEVSENNEKIRRSPNMPLPEMNEERRKELLARTVYAKGLPIDSTIDALLEFFGKYDGFENLVMRNYHDKATNKWIFKGSVFINFKTVADGEKFLKLEELKYNDADLIKMWQSDYIESKRKERLEEKAKREKKKQEAKAVKEKDKKTDDKDKEDDDEADEEEKDSFPKGTVVQLTDFTPKTKLNREAIKKKIEDMGIAVAFLDFNIGDEVAWVRLEEENAALELAKKVEEEGGKFKVNEHQLTLRVLEGDEEEKFLEKAKADMLKRREQVKSKSRVKRGRGGRGGQRNWSGNRKRKSNAADDSTPAKVAAK